MESLWQDVRYAARVLWAKPGFTAVAVVTLALGIGANSAVFSVADAFLFRPLPFRDMHHLAAVMEIRTGLTEDWSGVAPANFLDWKRQCRSFERLAGYAWSEVNLTGEGDPEKLSATLVTTDFFPLLGVEPLLGRYFLVGEDQAGREQVVVLSRGLWERRFGGDPSVVGRTVKIDGRSCTIAGVMPKQFVFPMAAELWMPLAMSPKDLADRTSRYVRVFGRLRSGVSVSAGAGRDGNDRPWAGGGLPGKQGLAREG
jgi:putative ABC transport system permease protein